MDFRFKPNTTCFADALIWTATVDCVLIRTPRIVTGCRKGASIESVVIVTSVPCAFHHNHSCTPLDTSSGANRTTVTAITASARTAIRSRVLVIIPVLSFIRNLLTEKLCSFGRDRWPMLSLIVPRLADEHHLQRLGNVNPTFELLLQRCLGFSR